MIKRKVIYEIKSLDNNIKRIIINKGRTITSCPPSPIQMRIIHYLMETDKDVYQKDLEKMFDLRRSTISGILKTMEKHNIIIRVDSDIDARVKKIILSDSSKDFHNKMMRIFMMLDNTLVNGISDDELKIFFSVIDRMKQNINELGK